MSIDFLCSRAWAELSPHAAKMLLDLCAGLGRNASGNGDLSAAPAVMEPKGWRSTATRVAALEELEAAGLIVVMRRGNRRACTLYAVTLWPLSCNLEKLDHGPGAYTTGDWRGTGNAKEAAPTMTSPAKWRALRKNESRAPVAGQHPPDMHPQRDNLSAVKPGYVPATGTQPRFSGDPVLPPRDTFLDMPSAVAIPGATASKQRPARAGSQTRAT